MRDTLKPGSWRGLGPNKQQNPVGLTVTTSAAKASYNIARVAPSSQEDIHTLGPGHGLTGLCVWEAQLPKAWKEGHALHC